MRLSFALVLLLPGLALAQPTAEQKKETVKWVTNLQDPGGGFYLAPQDPTGSAAPKPGLRATSGAVRALKYLGAEVPNKDKHAAFVLKCYDPKTGAFTEPGGKPDVTITSIGVMAATELGIPKEKFEKAMDYLGENAKTFEEVRIAAAAAEAWGAKDCPFGTIMAWIDVADKSSKTINLERDSKPDVARDVGSIAAVRLRLGYKLPEGHDAHGILKAGQLPDGGWGKKGEKASDIESTYRVMRAMMLLKEKPKDVKKLRAFIDSHRNKDGGYATKPGDKSSMSGAYYCAIVSKWLDELEAK
jgi:prenyltransferase beta subunit